MARALNSSNFSVSLSIEVLWISCCKSWMNFRMLGCTDELRSEVSNAGGGAGVSFGSVDSNSEYSTKVERKFFVVGVVALPVVISVCDPIAVSDKLGSSFDMDEFSETFESSEVRSLCRLRLYFISGKGLGLAMMDGGV